MQALPIGIENFKNLVDGSYYYVDKTLLIKDILDATSKVSLFTRPRRFGKTLAQSMIQTFFEIETNQDGTVMDNSSYFQGTKIAGAGEKYQNNMGKYPVIFLSLKSGKQPGFSMAYGSLLDEIQKEYLRHRYILRGDALTEFEKKKYLGIMNQEADEKDYAKAIEFLSKCLEEYHKNKVIILIDEYDVPLENAYFHGFYEEMIGFIRSLFESALKTNDSLWFAVVTGCLRISRESIFTGLNNLRSISVLEDRYDECFGFTPEEVGEILKTYHLTEKMQEVKQWYDGYIFGSKEVYNPWSILNYIDDHILVKDRLPKPYWANTSSNSIVRELIERADSSVKEEIENLLAGGTIEKAVHEDITYDSIYDSEENLWNFLFFTGYLKKIAERGEEEVIYLTMAIPNTEVKSIYKNSILNWFREEIKVQDLSPLYISMLEGKTEAFQKELSRQLQKSISYMDNKEAFYHGFLLGILANLKEYVVKSNREAGNGRYDICVRSQDETIPVVILELKVSKKFKDLEADKQKALDQIAEKAYDAWLPEEGYTQSIRYGIAFYKKKCRVGMVQKQFELE